MARQRLESPDSESDVWILLKKPLSSKVRFERSVATERSEAMD